MIHFLRVYLSGKLKNLFIFLKLILYIVQLYSLHSDGLSNVSIYIKQLEK